MNNKQALWKIYGAHKIIHLRPYEDWALIWKNVWKLELADSFYWEPPMLREKEYQFPVSCILGFIMRQ
jgi:hypothetical protein